MSARSISDVIKLLVRNLDENELYELIADLGRYRKKNFPSESDSELSESESSDEDTTEESEEAEAPSLPEPPKPKSKSKMVAKKQTKGG